MIRWLENKLFDMAVGLVARRIKKSSNPLTVEAIDKLNEKTILGMVEWYVGKHSGWKADQGTALSRLLEVGDNLGEVKPYWTKFWQGFQKEFDTTPT